MSDQGLMILWPAGYPEGHDTVSFEPLRAAGLARAFRGWDGRVRLEIPLVDLEIADGERLTLEEARRIEALMHRFGLTTTQGS